MHPTHAPHSGSSSGDGTRPGSDTPRPGDHPPANPTRRHDARNRLWAWAWIVAGLALVAYGTLVVSTPKDDGGGWTGFFVIAVALPMFWIARDTWKRGTADPGSGDGRGPGSPAAPRRTGAPDSHIHRATAASTTRRQTDPPELASALQQKLRELGAVRQEVDRLHDRLEFSRDVGPVGQDPLVTRSDGHGALGYRGGSDLATPGALLSPTLR